MNCQHEQFTVDCEPCYEKGLQELLDFITGRRPEGLGGTGIRTYNDDDPGHRMLHEGCLELERRGKIVLHMAMWRPKE